MKFFLPFKNTINWVLLFLLMIVAYSGHEIFVYSDVGDFQIFLTVVGSILIGIILICNMVVYNEHCQALARVRMADSKIQRRQEYIEAIQKQYDVMKKTVEETIGTNMSQIPEQLINQDSPVAALIQGMKGAWDELIQGEDKLNYEKRRKIDYQEYVEQRRIGMFSWVVDYLGTE